MDLIDDQNDIASLFDFFNQTLHTAFKLAAELGSGHQGCQIQQVYLFIPQLKGNIAADNLLCQAFSNGGFANAGLTNETGVIFLTAVENLDNPFGLHLPSNNLIQAAIPGLLGQVQTIAVQELALLVPAPGRRLLFGLLRLHRLGQLVAPLAAEQFVQKRESGCAAVGFVILCRVCQFAGVGCAAHHVHHFVGQGFQIFVCDSHLLHNIVHRFDAQLSGALQTETIVDRFAIFYFCDKNDCNIFLTVGT